jgi:CheY-like chemotaxis protein
MEPLAALFVSADRSTLSTAQRILEEHGLSIKVVDSAAAAAQLVKTAKFDLGIYDSDVPGILDLASGRSPFANPRMIFALVRSVADGNVAAKRIHFVVQKPFTADLFARTLRAAYGTMVRDRRISFRHPVHIKPASAILVQENATQPLHASTILDLSQTGMCLQTLEILPLGATLEIEFQLENAETIHVTGSVMWTRASGRTGVRFVHIPMAEQKKLIAWLDALMPCELDGIPRAALPRHDRIPMELRV